MLVENYSNSPPVWTVSIPGIFLRASGPTRNCQDTSESVGKGNANFPRHESVDFVGADEVVRAEVCAMWEFGRRDDPLGRLNLPGWRWQRIMQLCLVHSSSSWHFRGL